MVGVDQEATVERQADPVFAHVGAGSVRYDCDVCGAFIGGDNIAPYVIGLFFAAHNHPTDL